MTTFAEYVNSLLGNVTQTYGHNGETGVDIGLPYGSPVYALTPGVVVGSGYYGGGGVETIAGQVNAPNYAGLADTYYQHLSNNLLTPGQFVQAGQLIGYSGGQIGYGSHPSTTQFSNGPHIEIGLNAPYGGGLWGNQPGANVNPIPWISDAPNAQLATFGMGGGTGLPSAAQAGLFGLASPGATQALSPSALQGSIAAGVGSALGSALSPITGVIQETIAGLMAGVADALKRAGWFAIALGVMAAGVWLLWPQGSQSDAGSDSGGSSAQGQQSSGSGSKKASGSSGGAGGAPVVSKASAKAADAGGESASEAGAAEGAETAGATETSAADVAAVAL